MNTKPVFAQRHPATTAVGLLLAIFIGAGVLTAVAEAFQHDGAPFQQMVLAERACENHVFVSERTGCMRAFLARATAIASR